MVWHGSCKVGSCDGVSAANAANGCRNLSNASRVGPNLVGARQTAVQKRAVCVRIDRADRAS